MLQTALKKWSKKGKKGGKESWFSFSSSLVKEKKRGEKSGAKTINGV
jgi:hypothetical protein